ncbi:MAG: methyl-accepting chemotaxis protein [Dethiobacteria bacterium]
MQFNLRTKILVALGVLIIGVVFISTVVSLTTFNSYVNRNSYASIEHELEALEAALENKVDELSNFAQVLAAGQQLGIGLMEGNMKAVGDYIEPLAESSELDVMITNRSRKIIFKPHEPEAVGTEVENRYFSGTEVTQGAAGYSVEQDTLNVLAIRPINSHGHAFYVFAGYLQASDVVDNDFLVELRNVIGNDTSIYAFVDGKMTAKALALAEVEANDNRDREEQFAEYAREEIQIPEEILDELYASGEPQIVVGNLYSTGYYPVKDAFGEVQGIIVVEESRADELATAAATRNRLLGIGALILLVCIISGYKGGDTLVKPVLAVHDALKAIGAGDLTVTVNEELLGRDEIGDMGRTLNKEFGNQRQAMLVLKENAEQLAQASEQIASSSQEIAAGTQQQANEVQNISEMVNKNVELTKEVAQNAETASESAQEAVKAAEQGNSAVENTVRSMRDIQSRVKGLGTSSRKISEIIKVINEIADQTELLALNAAIEAARAGEHGRGFAVVADEVRKLAERSSLATKDIEKIVDEIWNETEEAVSEVDKGAVIAQEAGDALVAIINRNREVLKNMGNMFASSETMKAAGEKMMHAVESISAIVEETAAGAEETAAGAEELSAMADKLRSLTERFKLEKSDENTEEKEAEKQTETVEVGAAKKEAVLTEETETEEAIQKDDMLQ